MWDGRETFRDDSSSDCLFNTTTCFASLRFNLADQANSATTGHAQGTTPLTTEQRKAIVDFERHVCSIPFAPWTGPAEDLDGASRATCGHASGKITLIHNPWPKFRE